MKTAGTTGSRRSRSATRPGRPKFPTWIVVAAAVALVCAGIVAGGLVYSEAVACRRCGYKGRATLAFQVYCYSEPLGVDGYLFAMPYAIAMEACE